MIQEKKKIKSNSLTDIQVLKNCHLSIQFSLDGFSFCVVNTEKRKIEELHDFEFIEQNGNTPQKMLINIADLFDKTPILSNRFGSVSISHINDLSTLVPKPLFDENKVPYYVEFNNKVFKSDYFVYDELKNHEIVNVYIPYVNVNNFFLDQYGGFEFKHYSSVLIENLTKRYLLSIKPQVFVHIGVTHFEILVLANKKIQLYNTYQYRTKEDFIYYILFVAEQLKLNPEEFELHLLGFVDKDSKLYNIAYKYIRNVKLLENRSTYIYNKDITENDKRQYFTLLQQF